MLPITQTVLGDVYPLEERARITGLFSTVWGVAGLLGPGIGGFLTEHVSWRWVFYVNFPLCVLSMVLIWSFLHEHLQRRRPSIDYIGAVALSASVALLLVGLQSTGNQQLQVVLYLLAAVLVPVFIWQERRASEPLVPLWLFRQRAIGVSTLGGLLLGFALYGQSTFLPPFIQGVMGATPTVSGFVLATSSISWPFASALGGRLLLRWGFRSPCVLGGVLLTIGFVLLLALTPESGLWMPATIAFITGLGFGFYSVVIILAAQSSVGWQNRGVVTSANQFARNIGGTIGVSIAGAIFTAGRRHSRGRRDQSQRDPLADGSSDPGRDRSQALATGAGGLVALGVHAVCRRGRFRDRRRRAIARRRSERRLLGLLVGPAHSSRCRLPNRLRLLLVVCPTPVRRWWWGPARPMPSGSPNPRPSVRGAPAFVGGGLGVALGILAGAQLTQRFEQLVELGHLDIRLERAVRELLAEDLLEVENRRRIVDVDLDADRLVGAARHAHGLDRRGRDRVDVDLARADRLARAALGHVQRVGDFDDAGFERQAAFVDVVRQHGVDDFGDDHRQLRLDVDRREFAAQPVERDRHAQELVAVAMDGHADVVHGQPEQHDDARVVFGHGVVGDAIGLDAGLDQQLQQAIAMVHRRADVDWTVIVDRRAPRGAVGHVPEGLDLDIGFKDLDDLSRP